MCREGKREISIDRFRVLGKSHFGGEGRTMRCKDLTNSSGLQIVQVLPSQAMSCIQSDQNESVNLRVDSQTRE